MHMRLQFLLFNSHLSSVLKLRGHPLVGGDDAGMILRQGATEMLVDKKDQLGES